MPLVGQFSRKTDIETRIHTIPLGSWNVHPPPEVAEPATLGLEHGCVLYLPNLSFPVERDEAALFSPAILSSSKNASYDPSTGRVGGTTLKGADRDRLQRLMARFSSAASGLVDRLLPRYAGRLRPARASFRPAEISGRPTSWRKDDTRLHIDSFPARPVQGQRILRMFTNVNPSGRARSWRIGDEFEVVADRFVDRLSMPWPGKGALLQAFRITKSRRTAYDDLMLQLHDRMKQDEDFQRSSKQEAVEFPSGSSWMAFTDQVSHAARAGQYQLEQTFLLPVAAMSEEHRSPLRVLERIWGSPLV